ncbi:PREDICTED: MAM domain-containing glycosylphosphatidylinositol anchor protein 2-like [Fulmarus glacialis]|uniref:MAM domain-containing glycosylphosphatidylinositol anchor protein 2-like n=1 Tax=Fulmarus glacialis TaxID=30455 RepID=UPI00051B6270|nr:PREDICTED: MAM domain-containing glycosylphosphatidylinositol anchor protein 2-like [Fulmarus glacialis]
MGATALPAHSLRAQFAAAVDSHRQFTVFLSFKVFEYRTRNSPHPLRPSRGPRKMGSGVSRGLLLYPAQHLCSIREPNQFQFSTSLLGSLNVYLRLKGQTAIENPLWSSSGNKGQHWNQARVNINPPTSFQLIFEGIRGPGIEGDIAIDDVSIVEGECMKSDQPANNLRSGAVGTLAHIRLIPVIILMSVLSHQR